MSGQYNVIRGIAPAQQFLVSFNLAEHIPENHIVFTVIDFCDLIDFTPFFAKRRSDGMGSSFLDPKPMVGLILYATLAGVTSSRKIEQSCITDIAYILVNHHLHPDHSTIARFKLEYSAEFKQVFKNFSKLMVKSGLTRIGILAIDGTKIGGHASLSANITAKRLQRELEQLYNESLDVDIQGNNPKSGSEVSLTLPVSEQRAKIKERLEKAQKELEAEHKLQIEQNLAEIEQKRKSEEISGKKKRGRKLKELPAEPEGNKKVNTTDPESRIMKNQTGYIQGFNLQITANSDQFILDYELTNLQNDKQIFELMYNNALELEKDSYIENIEFITADAGYHSYNNMQLETEDGPCFLIPTKNERRLGEMSENDGFLQIFDTVCRSKDITNFTSLILASIGEKAYRMFMQDKPADKETIAKQVMDARLRIPNLNKVYKTRKHTVEPPFGDIKHNMGIRNLAMIGKEACSGMAAIVCLAHNLTIATKNEAFEKLLNYCGLRSIREKIPKFDPVSHRSRVRVAIFK